MFHWSAYPFLRISAAWIAGILLGINYSGDAIILYLAGGFMLIATLTVWIATKGPRFYTLNFLMGFSALAAILILGSLHAYRYNEKNDSRHIIHSAPISWYAGIINDRFEETPKFRRTTVRIRNIRTGEEWLNAKGTVQVYFPKESQFMYGDYVIIKGSPSRLSRPSNPGEFDYRKHLSRQNIFHSHFIHSDSDVHLFQTHCGSSFKAWILGLRESATFRIQKFITSPRERAVALALMIGLKNELDNDLVSAYGGSGAMHVLAVSGLHVGIVYAFILTLFGRMRGTAKGRVLFAAINLVALWIYCFLTGLSPSALRATIMFSLIVLSQTFNRQTYIYNSIFSAAFIILALNPFMIYSVGFQLSFLAVLGIAYLTTRIERRLTCNSHVLKWVWRIMAVSIAAQIAVLPLSIFYFHQAPVYFLAANLVVIPAAGVILTSGVALLALGHWEWAGALPGKILQAVIWLMNEWVFMIDKTPGSKLFPLEMSGFQTILIYLVLFLLFALFHTRKFRLLALLVPAIFMFMTIESQKVYIRGRQNMAVFYSIPGHAAIDFVKGKKSYLYASHDLIFQTETMQYKALPFHISHGLPLKHLNTLDLQAYSSAGWFDAIVFEGKKFVYIKKPGQCPGSGERIAVDFLTIGNNAVEDLGQINAMFDSRMIVIDATNKTSLAIQLMRQAEDMNLTCIALALTGAQIFEL